MTTPNLIFHDVEQNTDEWLDLRIGKVTGTGVQKIMPHYGEAFGEPAKKLALKIALEQLTGKRSANEENYSNSHMERGHEQEPIAGRLYEEQTFQKVSNGGFFERGNIGCSPDRLVYREGVVEIKSVIDTVHFANISRGGIDPSYKWQAHFNLLTTGREWLDFVSYCADYPEDSRLYIHRIHREECREMEYMMSDRINEFFSLVESRKAIIRKAA